MARDQEVLKVEKDNFVELTNSDVTEVAFAVLSGEVELIVTDDATPPSDGQRGLPYRVAQGSQHPFELTSVRAAGGSRLWALGVSFEPSQVWVDHA